MSVLYETVAPEYALSVDPASVWLQANYNFGNTVPGLSDDAEANRDRAYDLVRLHTAASQIIRIKPLNKSGFVDLGQEGTADDIVLTDGLITLDPDHILHANPADCGEIAVSGFSMSRERPVIGLFHASRKIVGEGGHIQPIDYLCDTYSVEPEDLQIKLSPSARKESYVFDDIDEAQKCDPKWTEYIGETETGQWYVDFHGRTVDDLLRFGIQPANMQISEEDTAGPHSKFFSYHRYVRGNQEAGANGLFFALR